MLSTNTQQPSRHTADIAEDLRSITHDLYASMVEQDAPAKYLSCGKMMSENAELLAKELAEVSFIVANLTSAKKHDIRGRLHKVSGPLQRLLKMDALNSFGQLENHLKAVGRVYESLRERIEPSQPNGKVTTPKTSVTKVPLVQPDENSKGPIAKGPLSQSPQSGLLEQSGRVLIVDDDWQACSLLEETIEDHGHIAISCRRPERVVETLREGAFDVCLLDLNMPTISGWQLLEQIKSDPMTKHVSVIVVSGSAEDDGATRAIGLGADDFIIKPVNFSLLAARIANCLSRSRQHLRELTRFLPLSVVESIRKHPNRLQQGQEATVTVMFCDIRRFSKFTEHMSPSETIRWISDVMGCLSQTILDEGGTLVDFVGDEVMSMWGAPQSRGDHAEAACRCALKVQDVVTQLSQRWFHVLGDAMEVGIGIHSGIVSVGNTGSPQRFKYGPLGNTVNLGSRVQGASKFLRSKILITRDTRRQIPRDMASRRLCSVRVNNIERPVELFELTTELSVAARRRDREYESSLIDFEEGRFSEALVKLGKLLTKHSEDGPSLLLMKRVIEAKLSDDSSFDPVWTMPGK